MLVKKACYWWRRYGDFPPEDERERAPRACAVVEAYRLVAKVDFPRLAEELKLSERMVRRIFHEGAGLDSIQRRRQLAKRLTIPPQLLGLDSIYWNRQDAWWVAEGYHAFPRGDDGYPHTGAVVRWYRKQRLKKKRDLDEERVSWTQYDLGQACDPILSENGVNEMEKHGVGLDSLNRRRTLAFLLSIPPALLGLDTAKHEPVLDLPSATLVLPKAPMPDILLGYQQHQEDLFTEYYTSHGQDTVGEAHWWITYLQDYALPLAQNDQQHIQVRSIEWRYHRLLCNIAGQQRDHGEALLRANIAVALAEEMGDTEYLILALQMRAVMLQNQGPLFYNMAQADTDRGLALVKQAVQEKHPLAPAVEGLITLEAGEVQSFTAQLKQERDAAKALLQKARRLSQQAVGEVDTHVLKLDPGWYHLVAARALTVWYNHNPVTFKEHIDEATRLTDPALQRRHLIIQRVRAQGELLNARKSSGLKQDQHYAEATRLATEALPIARSLNTRLNRDRIQEIYNELSESSYGEEPTVAHLGLLLQNWP
jgi:hypothetical protein